LAKSTARLLQTVVSAQSSTGAVDKLTNQIVARTIDMAPALLSAMKALALSTGIAFAAHLVSFLSKRHQ